MCDPNRYKSGQWQNQNELNQLVQQSFQCDGASTEQPWIGQAYAELGYRYPRRIKYSNSTSSARFDIDECDARLYGAGFSGYNDLKAKVEQYKSQQQLASPSPGTTTPSRPLVPGIAPAPPASPSPTPEPDAVFRFTTTPDVYNVTAGELRQFTQLARDLGIAAQASAVPEMQDAASFMAAAASLASLLANPNQLTAMAGAGELADPRVASAIEQAVREVVSQPRHIEAFRAFNHAALKSAWLWRTSGVVAAAPWMDRSFALVTDETLAIPDIKNLRQSIDWTKYDKAETLFLLIEIGQLMKQAQTALSFVNKLSDLIEKAVEKVPGLEDMPVPQFQAAMKVVAVTSIITEISGQVLEGAAAFVPARVAEFYVRVNGQDRKAGAPPIIIDKDKLINLDVFITYATYGGELDTPWTLIQLAAEKLLKTRRVAAAIAKIKARGGAAAAQLEKQVEDRIKGDGYRQLVAKLEQHFRANSGVYGAVGKKIFEYVKEKSPKYKIAESKGSTEINSDKVLFMESKSANLVKVGQTGSNKFYLQGLMDSGGREAGYHVALKKILIERMVRAPGSASPNLLGTVIVKDTQQPPPPSGIDTSCYGYVSGQSRFNRNCEAT